MRIERGHRHIASFAGADRLEEAVPLAAFFGFRSVSRDGDGLAFAGLAFFVGEEALLDYVHPFGSEEVIAAVAAVSFLKRAEIADLEGHDRAVGVSEGGRLSIRCLTVVIQTIAAAGTVHPDRKATVVAPAGDVHLVHALIADLAVAVF